MLFLDKELFQYERGRYLCIDERVSDKIDHVQFYNTDSSNTQIVSITALEDNSKIAYFPDNLLTENYPITAIGCKYDEETGSYWGVTRKQFSIIPRPRPSTLEEEAQMTSVQHMMPYVLLKKLPKKPGWSKAIKIECRNLVPNVKYTIYLETRSRYRGTKVGEWRHPSNGRFDSGVAMGYHEMIIRQSNNDEDGVEFPAVPSWMPNNGFLQTEWEFVPTKSTWSVTLPISDTFDCLRKPIFDKDGEILNWNCLVGTRKKGCKSLEFRFTVFEASSEYVVSQFRTTDTLRLGFSSEHTTGCVNVPISYVSIT